MACINIRKTFKNAIFQSKIIRCVLMNILQFLQKMLDDRQPSVESVRSIGNDLAQQADGSEKHQLESQLNDLLTRWEKLSQFADSRQQALDIASQVSVEHIVLLCYGS